MAVKASIARSVPADQVALKVPHEFRRVVDQRRLDAGPYIVIAFPGMKSSSASIVDSKTLSRALASIESESGTVVAVAHDFTMEARDMLAQRSAILFSDHEFSWTDESLANVRRKGQG